MSGPVLPYGSETPDERRPWVRVVSWIALACGVLFWVSFAFSRIIPFRLPTAWTIVVFVLTAPGLLLGFIGVIWSGARSMIAWIGFSMNLAVLGFFAYFMLNHR